jgi:HSP20 family protein
MITRNKSPFRDVLDTFFESNLVFNESNTKLSTKEDGYYIHMSVPGLTKTDLKITTNDGYLTISYNKENNKEGVYSFTNSFKRTYIVPDNVNEKDISGKVENGVLELFLPKTKKKQSERLIELN